MDHEEHARRTANDLLSAINSMSFDYKAFANEIATSHRTLQQSVMRAFVECVKTWGDGAQMYDLRNEDTVKLSTEMVKHFGDRLYLRYV